MNNYTFYDYVIELDKKIGQGQFGIVVECYHKTKYKDVQLCAKIVQNNQNIDESLVKEIQILRKIKSFNNKHLIKVYDMFEAEKKFFIIMERCSGGELKHVIEERKKNNKTFTTQEILDFVYQFVDGYQILYDNKIMHRDIKPQNVFVDQNSTYKIGDLGAGRILEDVKMKGDYTKIGSPIYSSPQVLKLQPFSSQTDIYSLGMVVYQLAFLKFPFQANIQELQRFISTIQQKKKLQVDTKIENEGVQREKDEIQFLIENMLIYEENERLSWEQLFQRIRNEIVYATFRQKYQNQDAIQLEQSIIIGGKRQKKLQKEKQELKEATETYQKQLVENIQIHQQYSQLNQERKRSPLSQYLKIQSCKVTIVSNAINYFKDILFSQQLNLSLIEYFLILSSMCGYYYNLLQNIDAIHKGEYNQLSEHIKNQKDKENLNRQVILEFQGLKSDEDIIQRDKNTDVIKKFIGNYCQTINQTISIINQQKIRFQTQCEMRDLLYNFQSYVNYYKYWELFKKFYQSYLHRQLITYLQNDINQLSEIQQFFMVYIFELCGLEEKYKQLELFKGNKIQIIPQQVYSRQEAINYLQNKRNEIQQQNNQNPFY